MQNWGSYMTLYLPVSLSFLTAFFESATLQKGWVVNKKYTNWVFSIQYFFLGKCLRNGPISWCLPVNGPLKFRYKFFEATGTRKTRLQSPTKPTSPPILQFKIWNPSKFELFGLKFLSKLIKIWAKYEGFLKSWRTYRFHRTL